ncbi:hypothetical protein CIB48_g10480 [Xylaria polymorpha]|nr:hypothetical protein CIB48_g10480 [Xylaria polymorpha]
MRARPRVKLIASFCAPRPQPVTPALSQPPPPARWVSDVRARIGKCISFGCDAAQIQRAAGVLGILANEWRALSAGSEGFLTGRLRGLENQQVVWGEMDSFGHVNNTVYIRYAESARVNWILHFAMRDPEHREAWSELMKPKSIGLIMKSIQADFKHRRVAARTFEDIAIYDYREAKKTVLPGFMLDVLRETWHQQEERTDWARGRIWGLLNEVERLEKETWDREGAVEDMGAATK